MLISDEEKEKWLNRAKNVGSKLLPNYYKNAENAKKFYSGAGKMLVDTLRAGPRTGAQIAMTRTGQKEYQPGATGNVLPSVEKALLGNDKLGDLQSRYESNKEFAQGAGLGKASASLAGAGTLAGVALDVIPSTGSGGKTVVKEGAETLLKKESKDVIKRAVKAGIPKAKVNWYKKGMEETLRIAESRSKSISKAVANGIEDSVLQIVDEKTKETIYKMIPKGDLKKFHDAIDNPQIGDMAGLLIKGKRYHITAHNPDWMESRGAIPAGIATIEEIPKIPRWIKDQFGKFEGSLKRKTMI